MKEIIGYKLNVDWAKMYKIFLCILFIFYIILCIVFDSYINYDDLLMHVISMQFSILFIINCIYFYFTINKAISLNMKMCCLLIYCFLLSINFTSLILFITDFNNLNNYLISNDLNIFFYIFYPISLVPLFVYVCFILHSIVYIISFIIIDIINYIKQTINIIPVFESIV